MSLILVSRIIVLLILLLIVHIGPSCGSPICCLQASLGVQPPDHLCCGRRSTMAAKMPRSFDCDLSARVFDPCSRCPLVRRWAQHCTRCTSVCLCGGWLAPVPFSRSLPQEGIWAVGQDSSASLSSQLRGPCSFLDGWCHSPSTRNRT